MNRAILLGAVFTVAFTTNAFALVKYTLTKSDGSKIVISTGHNNPDDTYICRVNKNGNANSSQFSGTVAQALAKYRGGRSVKTGGFWPC